MFSIPSEKLSKSTSSLLLLLLLGVTSFIYMGALNVPFYLDDVVSIVNNNVLHSGSVESLYQQYGLRLGGYLTFYLNYSIDGKEPYFYHLFNIGIHLANGVFAYLFSLSLLAFIEKRNAIKPIDRRWVALFVAGIWLLHPLNSQPVIYVVQRLAELAALGFFITAFAYFQFRNSTHWSKFFWIVLCVLGLGIGLGAKQNYFTVFVFIFVIEYIFGSATLKQRFNWLAIIGTVIFAILIPFISELLAAIDFRTRENYSIARSEYFYSQLVVLFIYIRKFFLPYDLQLFMEVDIFSKVTWPVFLAFVGHAALISVAYVQRKRLPFVCIGFVLFYSAHLVESSIIPITDFAFEHRTYIPNLGLCFVLFEILRSLVIKIKLSPRNIVTGSSVLFVMLAVVTLTRVAQWQDSKSFFEREVKLSPTSPLANQSYGYELMIRQQYEEAEPYLANAYNYKLERNQLSVSNLNLYMTVLFHLDKYAQANRVANKAMQYIRYAPYRSQILGNMSYGYIKMGMCDFAINIAKRAVDLDPNNRSAKQNYQYCLQAIQAERQGKNLGANK